MSNIFKQILICTYIDRSIKFASFSVIQSANSLRFYNLIQDVHIANVQFVTRISLTVRVKLTDSFLTQHEKTGLMYTKYASSCYGTDLLCCLRY